MKLILFNDRTGKHWLLPLGLPLMAWLLVLLTLVAAGMGWLQQRFTADARQANALLETLSAAFEAQQASVQELDEALSLNLQVSAARIAGLESRLLRLDALGQRLTETANLDDSEFQFFKPIGVGGPFAPMANNEDVNVANDTTELELRNRLALLSDHIEWRSDQLSVVERILLRQQREEESSLYGKPVTKGWVSSNYGMRTDPISGKRAWHNGIDIAGSAGTSVIAIASGIVTFAGERSGYGKMVEINHGGGVVTRYAHHQRLSVATGELVKKGQKIGEMGSSGRSTGPHVHYEIYKNERSIDPAIYIYRSRSG